MLFKKKEAIDIRDIPRKSVNMPNGRGFVAKDGLGFVDLTKKKKVAKTSEIDTLINKPVESPSTSSGGFVSFFDTPTVNSPATDSDSSEALRKISMQLSDLDTKLYKMEQRIELIERKVGVGGGGSGFSW